MIKRTGGYLASRGCANRSRTESGALSVFSGWDLACDYNGALSWVVDSYCTGSRSPQYPKENMVSERGRKKMGTDRCPIVLNREETNQACKSQPYQTVLQ